MVHLHTFKDNINISEISKLLKEREDFLPLMEYYSKEVAPNLFFQPQSSKKIKELRINNAIKNLLFLNEFKLIVESFNNANINLILLKGLAMEPYYPDGLRTFSDIDILVHKKDLKKIDLVMGELGYSQNNEPREGAINVRKNIGYTKKKGRNLLVECHFLLGPTPYLDRLQPKTLFREAESVKFGDVETLVLSLEDTLINLALHIFSHIPDPCIVSICDIRQLILHNEKDINWDILISKTVKYKLAMPMRFAFNRVLEVFDIQVLSSVLDKLKNIRISKREELILSLLENPNRKVANLGKLLFGFRTMRKVQLIIYMLFPSLKYIQERFKVNNSKFLFLYYFKNIKENVIMSLSWFLGN